jgi:HAMP domain-containing protein
MSFFNTLKLKDLLLLSALGVMCILVVIIISINFFSSNMFSEFEKTETVERIAELNLKVGSLEKEFLLYETKLPSLYANKTTESLKEIELNIKQIKEIIGVMNLNNQLEDQLTLYYLQSIEKEIEAYQNNLTQFKSLVLNKGFKDFGTIGEMRKSIHDVEGSVNELDDLKGSKYMLLLRRHEKDYLLRKDLKYKKKFEKTYNSFVSYLKENDNRESDRLIVYLNKYQDLFYTVLALDESIGLNNEDGFIKLLNDNKANINDHVDKLSNHIKMASEANVSENISLLYVVLSILSVLIILLLYRVSRRIMISIKSLEKHLKKLGKGELPDEFEVQYEDEIGAMKKSINTLTQNLKNTKDFAIAVGHGNFKKEVNVFGNKGELGGSLIEMRNQLLKVAEERADNEEIDRQTLWTNKGISLFSDIVRDTSVDMDKVSYTMISELISYVEANQGYIYIIENQDEKDVAVLRAAYAFNRRKFVQDTIEIGEGLVGNCILEQKTIYLTDIPDDYINITSGLGDARPRTLLVVPLIVEEHVLGVIEIATFEEMPKYKIDFIERVANIMASYTNTVQNNIKTQELLEKTRLQAQYLKQNEEEMRQNIEELKVTQDAFEHKEQEYINKIDALEKQINAMKKEELSVF